MSLERRMIRFDRWFVFSTLLVVAALLLSACAPSLPATGGRQTPTAANPGSGPTAAPQPTELPAWALPVVEALAQQLKVGRGAVQVVSVEKVDWPNACLGVEAPGTMCAQVITPGYRVMLEARGQRYEYRTNLDGTVVNQAPEQVLSDVALAWHRDGGIAGFCDELTVYQTGESVAFSCKGGTSEELAQAPLEPAEMEKLNDWTARLVSFEFTQTDPAKADAMTVRVVFMGNGATAPSDADKQAMQEWAAQVFATLTQ